MLVSGVGCGEAGGELADTGLQILEDAEGGSRVDLGGVGDVGGVGAGQGGEQVDARAQVGVLDGEGFELTLLHDDDPIIGGQVDIDDGGGAEATQVEADSQGQGEGGLAEREAAAGPGAGAGNAAGRQAGVSEPGGVKGSRGNGGADLIGEADEEDGWHGSGARVGDDQPVAGGQDGFSLEGVEVEELIQISIQLLGQASLPFTGKNGSIW